MVWCSALSLNSLSAERVCPAVTGLSQRQVHSGDAAETGRTREEPDRGRQREGTRGIQRSAEGQSSETDENRGPSGLPDIPDFKCPHRMGTPASHHKLWLRFLQVTSPQWQNLEQRESYQRLVETVSVLHRLARRLSSRAELVGAVRQVRPCRGQKKDKSSPLIKMH